MTRWVVGAVLVLGLGLVLTAAGPDAAADDAKDAKAKSTPAADTNKIPEFAGYTTVTTITGEVVKATDGAVTVRLYWLVATGGTRGARPRLYANHGRSMVNPFTVRRPAPQVRWEHHDYELEYVADSMVRHKTLPPRTDEAGKKIPYSDKERDELKKPFGVPGYQAAKTDLKPGTVVEVVVIRDKAIPADKVGEDDMRIKYVIIIGEDPNPPKDIASPAKKDEKKKN